MIVRQVCCHNFISFGVQLRLTLEYLEMKRYESLSKMAKVYYGPSIPNFMIELPQSLTNTVTAATTNTNSDSYSKMEDKKVNELNPPASSTQKT